MKTALRHAQHRYESRGSRTVSWEGRGEIPLPDPIICDFENTKQTNPQEKSIKFNVAL